MTVFAVATAVYSQLSTWVDHGNWLLPYPNQRGLWVNFDSPHYGMFCCHIMQQLVQSFHWHDSDIAAMIL